MPYWERNTAILGLGSLIGGAYYVAMVLMQSMAIGAVAPPSLFTFNSYFVLQIAISAIGVSVSTAQASKGGELAGLPGGMDERDRFVKTKSEAGFGHLLSAVMFLALAAWFLHHNASLLFHSVVVGHVIAELGRAGLQLASYRRGA